MAKTGPSINRHRSAQDFGTPGEFLAAVTKRFGPIQFDLSAHAANAKHERYFAPPYFDHVASGRDTNLDEQVASLARRGADAEEARGLILSRVPRDGSEITILIPNRDRRAFGFDAFRHENHHARDWALLSRTFTTDGRPGLLWDNCEFADIAPWAAKHAEEARNGANSALLTPATFTNWYRDHVARRADVYELLGRLCFDGKNGYPKDCRLSHFHPGATGRLCVWDWQRDRIEHEWEARR